MQDNVRIRALSKRFGDFLLDDVSFDVPAGSVVGFIGENGAGKSTTIKSILGLVNTDGGRIEVFGKDARLLTEEDKGDIGVVLGEHCLPQDLTLREVNAVMRRIFRGWQEGEFFSFVKRFALPENKKLRSFSGGMRQKAALSAALSHGARLLLLDEPTAGLDPVARDEILDVLYDFMQDECRSVLLSSHILSDLEKLCDHIVFIHGGKIVFAEEKDVLTERYALFRGSAEEVGAFGRGAVAAYMRGDFGMSALVYRDKVPAGTPLDRAGIEDIMLYFVRGERV